MDNKKTSWGEVSSWYNSLLSGEGTYQADVILPGVLRLLAPKTGEAILDVACGQGFFSRELARLGAKVTGTDIASELIAIAKKQGGPISYHTCSADAMTPIESNAYSKALMVLALQNVEHAGKALQEIARTLTIGGTFVLVLNHPAFRIPEHSSWEYDEKGKIQYRRLNRYLSESVSEIKMNPGKEHSSVTYSFHRPLQFYSKALEKAGFVITRMEEWSSHKVSDKGPRKEAEDRARAEFPLFLAVVARKDA